jgi:sigma-B regulation protein RsbU (phosphoserine phosphatase)
VRRRFERLADELYSILRDVLGDDRAGQAWETLPRPDDHEGADAWTEALPEIVKAVQSRVGRGLARELNAQIRLTLEEYRS